MAHEQRVLRPLQFAITDILPENSCKKVDLPLPLSPVALGPLSLPRSQKNVKQTACGALKASRTDLPSPIEFSSSSYAERLQQAENTELFSYASALCYRVTGRYLPRALLQSDPEAQQRELERVQRDPEILRAIDSVRVLSVQFKEVAQTAMGHRRELGHRLFRIEESYLKLFEKLLELSLRLYWEYEQRTGAQRKEDHVNAERWRDKYEQKCVETAKLDQKLAAREIVHRAREIELLDYQGQMKEMEKELETQSALETRICQLECEAAVQRGLESKLLDNIAELTKRHENMIEHQKRLHEESQAQRKELTNELKRAVREKERLIIKQEATLHHMEEIVPTTSAVYESRSSQTEVNDDGLWDVQDGIPRFVSKNVTYQMVWRRLSTLAICKNCLSKKAKADFALQDASDKEIDIWSVRKGKKRTKTNAKRVNQIEQQWRLPSYIVLFLSNLPKSVVAFPFYPLVHVISQIEAIFDDKFASDRADEADGVAREELPRFICEYFLKTHGLRQSAELGLYRFLISVKNTYQRNSHVRLFARFANLLKHQDESTELSSPTIDQTTAAKSFQPGPASNLVPRNSSGYLDRTFLRVFLEARHYLLRPPPPRARRKGKAITSQDESLDRPMEHVIQVEPTKKWVPLDHAITVLRWYISCLAEDAISRYCRQVEHNAAIYDGRTITEIAGNRLAVRAEMRRVMLASETSELPSTTQIAKGSKGRQRPLPPRIVADAHKVLQLLMDALEQRREGIEKDLTALFDAGDVNHDCVLTLDEFSAIIRQQKPHFSDRRILRMFREAVMGGIDQSFALSKDAFVAVCNDHGLVSLLPDDQMTDPFSTTESELEARKVLPSKKSTKVASQAMDTAISSMNVVIGLSESDDSDVIPAQVQEVEYEQHMDWERTESDLGRL